MKRPDLPPALQRPMQWYGFVCWERYETPEALFEAVVRPFNAAERAAALQAVRALQASAYSTAELAGMLARAVENGGTPRAARVHRFLEALARALQQPAGGQG